jgi:hypothetical protein
VSQRRRIARSIGRRFPAPPPRTTEWRENTGSYTVTFDRGTVSATVNGRTVHGEEAIRLFFRACEMGMEPAP